MRWEGPGEDIEDGYGGEVGGEEVFEEDPRDGHGGEVCGVVCGVEFVKLVGQAFGNAVEDPSAEDTRRKIWGSLVSI